MTSFADRLCERILQTRSVTCVGLDPRRESLPAKFLLPEAASASEWAAAYAGFCKGVIDAVHRKVPVVKPQAAFFEQLGPAGMTALYEVIRYANECGLLVILDGKRNDIGSTAEAYADAYLGAGSQSPWGSDALTVSPYLGDDSLTPFVDRCDQRAAGIFVLVKTSNAGGGMLQDRDSGGARIYEMVADHLCKLNQSRSGEHGYGPIGAVVGATYPAQLRELRTRLPNGVILIPGFGAQGGGAEDVRGGFDARGLGAVVNSSRHIIFAYRRSPYKDRFGDAKWQEAVAAATDEMNAQLRVVFP